MTKNNVMEELKKLIDRVLRDHEGVCLDLAEERSQVSLALMDEIKAQGWRLTQKGRSKHWHIQVTEKSENGHFYASMAKVLCVTAYRSTRQCRYTHKYIAQTAVADLQKLYPETDFVLVTSPCTKCS